MRSPILFTIPNFITAGSGQAMLNIIARLNPEKFAPAVCVMRKGGALDREVEALGVPFIEAPFTLSAWPYHTLLSRSWKAAQAFRSYRFVLWHSFHYLDDFTEPIIARLAGARAWVYTKKNMNWGRRSWYLRTLLATRVAAQNSDMMRDFFGHWLFRRRVRSVPRGVDVGSFHPDVPRRLRLREQSGIPAEATVVGCVAHLVPVKGHPTLIEAIARVPGVFLLVAGKPIDQAYAASLEQMAQALRVDQRIRFVGGIRDVPAFLSELDLFVLPTWAQWRMEGCPVALLEAMASGRACVATDIPGSHDLVEHDLSGWLVPPGDVDALAAALQHLAACPDRRHALGHAARARAVQSFSIEREVAAHEALYREILPVG
jgi:glycosyltransferase involved in cell wall biosynthesis